MTTSILRLTLIIIAIGVDPAFLTQANACWRAGPYVRRWSVKGTATSGIDKAIEGHPHELALKIHLGSKDLQDSWAVLEKRWHAFEARAELGRSAQGLIAAAIGGVHLCLAAMALLIAVRPDGSREAGLASDVRDEALLVLSDDVREIRRDIASFARIVRHPFDGALLNILGRSSVWSLSP